MKVSYSARTDRGKVRSKNEDCFILAEVCGGSHLLVSAIDGCGGFGYGDVASNTARECICEHINALNKLSPNEGDILKSAVTYADNTILDKTRFYNSSMACVLTAALINLNSGKMSICHVGDTRLYIYKGGKLEKQTHDHSRVGLLEETGQISEEEAMKHPQRNLITRRIGGGDALYDPNYIQSFTTQLEPCTLLLCSDGLYDMVHSSVTSEILKEKTSVEERVNKLVSAALEAGGKDNITVVVVDIE